MEWYRQNQQQAGLFSLPTPAEKAGDFSRLLEQQSSIPSTVAARPTAISQERRSKETLFRRLVSVLFRPACCSTSRIQRCPALSTIHKTCRAFSQPGKTLGGSRLMKTSAIKQSVHFAVWRDRQSSYGGGNFLPPANPLQNNTYYPDLGYGVPCELHAVDYPKPGDDCRRKLAWRVKLRRSSSARARHLTFRRLQVRRLFRGLTSLDPFHLRELTAAPTCTEPPTRIR